MLDALGRVAFARPPPRQDIERKGLAVMQRVVAAAVREFPDTRFVGFSADGKYEASYRDIFRASGADFLEGVAAQVKASSRERIDCAPADSHWNHAGNRVVGAVLARQVNEFAVSKFFPRTDGYDTVPPP